MAIKNTTCKNCGELFHTCGSCGLVNAEWDYCSSACWNAAGTPIYTNDDGDEEDGLPFLMSSFKLPEPKITAKLVKVERLKQLENAEKYAKLWKCLAKKYKAKLVSTN